MFPAVCGPAMAARDFDVVMFPLGLVPRQFSFNDWGADASRAARSA